MTGEADGVRRGPAIAIDALSYSYPKSGANVLEGVELCVQASQHLALIGRSGCGKSTLLNVIAGLAQPSQGRVSVFGNAEPEDRLALAAIMPQQDSLLPWLNLLDNVSIPMRNRGIKRSTARQRAHETLEQWGLSSWESFRPNALSGGMRQRGALARALLADKPVLLADEPLGALDTITRAEIQEWLRRTITRTNTTMVMVTHDVDEALLLSHEVVLLAEPSPGAPASSVASWHGWFDDERPREILLGDPEFAESRREILHLFAQSGASRMADR